MEAEEEKIVEHVKEAVHTLTDKKKNWKAKISSFLWEILVIVIAVNLTIWFHNWNDKRHEQAQVKDFLIDIRASLVEDTTLIKQYINFYENGPLVYYDTVLSQIKKNKIDAQYVDSYFYELEHNASIEFNYSVYQSFSSANNLRLIENRQLLNDIVNLYSSKIPLIQSNIINLYNKRSDGFDKYVGYKIGIDSNGMYKLSTIITQPDVKNLIQKGHDYIREVNEQAKNLINQIDTLIPEIDKELKDKFGYTIKTK